MKRIARVLVALALVGFIGLILWHDWLRDRISSEPVAAPLGPPGPVMEAEREIVGIGVLLKRDDQTGALTIISILPKSPAEKAGLTAGSIVHKINDQPTEGLGLAKCVGMIRGRVGSKLRLQVSDPDQAVTNSVEVIRERVVLPERMR